MSNIFGNLTTEGVEETEDRLGGFSPLDTDAYDVEIKMAYAIKSDGGAQGVVLIGNVPSENDREYRETIYVTKRTGENYYEKDGKKHELPGFTTINNLCLVTIEKPLAQVETEEKMVKVWDKDKKTEVPTSVPVLHELVGKMVTLGIQRVMENVNEKQGDKYVPTAKVREFNQIDAVFHHESKRTVAEARSGKEEPDFFEKWTEKNKGVTRDNREIKDGQAGNAGAPPKAGAQASSAPSLFGGDS